MIVELAGWLHARNWGWKRKCGAIEGLCAWSFVEEEEEIDDMQPTCGATVPSQKLGATIIHPGLIIRVR